MREPSQIRPVTLNHTHVGVRKTSDRNSGEEVIASEGRLEKRGRGCRGCKRHQCVSACDRVNNSQCLLLLDISGQYNSSLIILLIILWNHIDIFFLVPHISRMAAAFALKTAAERNYPASCAGELSSRLWYYHAADGMTFPFIALPSFSSSLSSALCPSLIMSSHCRLSEGEKEERIHLQDTLLDAFPVSLL